jgi:Fe-S cluster assembly iron-binding protein IscA
MITVTERAAAGLQELLTTNHAQPGQGVKLVRDAAGNIGLTIAAPNEGDEVIRRDEQPLLIVDGRIAGALDGAQIDCDTTMVEGQPTTEFRLEPRAREG